jgi:hypothetical protein
MLKNLIAAEQYVICAPKETYASYVPERRQI